MTHTKSVQINIRFFSAIETLKSVGRIESKLEFCQKYRINPGNFTRLQKEPQREFELALLSYIVEDFGISPGWLLTGHGSMFIKAKTALNMSNVPKNVPA